MTAARNLVPSDEAHWVGVQRCWASIQQFPPRKDRSLRWLVLASVVLVAALWGSVRFMVAMLAIFDPSGSAR